MDEKSLGKRLQEARRDHGLTQQQLCGLANLSFSTLTKIERGAIKSPSIFTIQSIAGALNVGLDELLGNNSSVINKNAITKSGASFIYFDVNGCLIYFYQKAFDLIANEYGLRSDLVESAVWHYNDEACKGTISLEDFNHRVSEKLGIENFKWQNYYLEAVEPVKEVHDILIQASKIYRVGLLSNIMPGLLGSLIKAGKVPNIKYDVIIDSSEIGYIKPEKEIFNIAREKAGVEHSQIMFIDDSRINIMAAEKLDWHVLWFDISRLDESSNRIKEVLNL